MTKTTCMGGEHPMSDAARGRTPAEPSSHSILGSPFEIAAVTSQGVAQLLPTTPGRREGGGVRLDLLDGESCLALDVGVSGKALSQLVIRWKHPSHFLFLGDHWERSYGDLHWERENPSRIMPWYFLAYDGHCTHGVGVRVQGNAFAHWKAYDDLLELVLDTRCGAVGVELGGRTLRAAEVVVRKGSPGESPFEAARRFCTMMCPEPRLSTSPVYGINDWYFAYGDISRQVILDHASLLAPMACGNTNAPFCVIDAGWAPKAPGKEDIPCWADRYDVAAEAFGDMAVLAADLRKLGYRPGLWTRPLCASIKDHASRLLPALPRVEKYADPLLDPSVPDVLEAIKHNIRVYREWGYEMIKHDFSTVDLFGKWGFQMIADRDITLPGWHFHDRSLTSAEVVLQLYRTLREAAGNDLLLLGCNTVSHLAAGLFEVNRIGDDTSGKDWDRTLRMGVNTLGFRAVQHNTFYSADADCAGLTLAVSWEKNRQWLQLLAESGTPLFVSAQREAVGPGQAAFIRQCFTTASQSLPTGEPLDWLETPFPSRWKLKGREIAFDWGHPGHAT